MTIRDREVWMFAACFLIIAIVGWVSLFVALYQPVFEIRDSFAVIDAADWSLSLQGPHGVLSLCLSSKGFDWRIWTSGE
jgi:hypothetical protein